MSTEILKEILAYIHSTSRMLLIQPVYIVYTLGVDIS